MTLSTSFAIRNQLLIQAPEPQAVVIYNENGKSPYLLTCEHAGQVIPGNLAQLGLSPTELNTHIAWDVGAEATARRLADRLDATLVIQRYSRLTIDCNRPLDSRQLIPVVSDGTRIHGNNRLSKSDREARIREIYDPFQMAVKLLLDRSLQQSKPTALIAVHTFTPAMQVNPQPRPWDLGLLYNRDSRLALMIDQAFNEFNHQLFIAHNVPYSVSDQTDHTLPVHGEQNNIKHILLEIRNDHVLMPKGQNQWAELLNKIFRKIESKI